MRLLVIGGGRFFGRALVEAALADGHDVTAVQRGQTSAEAPAGLELLTGDRDSDLEALLAEREFDWAVDTCGYLPGQVQTSAALLADRVGRYLFVSTISTYTVTPGVVYLEDESPLDNREVDPTILTDDNYGALKALCEQVVLDIFGDRALIVRPGLIVGPNDPSDRFTYWPRRLSEPGPILVPDGPHTAFQVIDARDLARFCLSLLGAERSGIVNAVSDPYSFADLIAAAGSTSEIAWAPEDWLTDQGVAMWTELPLWLGETNNVLASTARAIEWGLTLRPLAQTVADTLTWDTQRGLPFLPLSLTRARETELIAALGAG